MLFLAFVERDGNAHCRHENKQRHRGEAGREHLIAAKRPRAPLAPASRPCRHCAFLMTSCIVRSSYPGTDRGKVQIKALQGGHALVAEPRLDTEKS
jgi:hypothetical protein